MHFSNTRSALSASTPCQARAVKDFLVAVGAAVSVTAVLAFSTRGPALPGKQSLAWPFVAGNEVTTSSRWSLAIRCVHCRGRKRGWLTA
jgi:hypothetical protein